MRAALTLLLSIALGAPFAAADELPAPDNTWGETTATPEPRPDTTGRDGHWFWPTTPEANAADEQPWGNRGVVFGKWRKPGAELVAPPVHPPVVNGYGKPVINNILFDLDKAVLTPQSKAIADLIIAELKKYPADTVLIQGHTCDTGSDAVNMALGLRRANAVRDYMLQMGIAPERMTVESFGESSPAVPNSGEENRKFNRRVIFQYTIVK